MSTTSERLAALETVLPDRLVRVIAAAWALGLKAEIISDAACASNGPWVSIGEDADPDGDCVSTISVFERGHIIQVHAQNKTPEVLVERAAKWAERAQVIVAAADKDES